MTLLEAPWGNRDAEMNICWPYPEVVDGYALPLEGPGLGIQFDEELAASKPFVPLLQTRLNALMGRCGISEPTQFQPEPNQTPKELLLNPALGAPCSAVYCHRDTRCP